MGQQQQNGFGTHEVYVKVIIIPSSHRAKKNLYNERGGKEDATDDANILRQYASHTCMQGTHTHVFLLNGRFLFPPSYFGSPLFERRPLLRHYSLHI